MLFILPELDIEDVLIFTLYLLHVLHADLAAAWIVFFGCMNSLSQVARPLPRRIATAHGSLGALISLFPLDNTQGAVTQTDLEELT